MLDAESRFRLKQMIEQHDYVQPAPVSQTQLGNQEPPSEGAICVYHLAASAPIESILVDSWAELMPVLECYAGAVRVLAIRGSATNIRAMLFLEDDRVRPSKWVFNERS